MKSNVQIRKIEKHDFETLLSLAKELPEWFTEKGLEKIATDSQVKTGFVAVLRNEIIGFIIFHTYDRATVDWIAVKREFHRQGVGTLLLKQVEADLFHLGIKEYYVETLGPGVDYPPYESTRAFYLKNDFIVQEIVKQDNPECEELLILQKTL